MAHKQQTEKYNRARQHHCCEPGAQSVLSAFRVLFTGTRQLTVNTCLVNAYDVLKPPCMAATVAYSNPMRRRPIVVAYIQCGLLIRARGC